MCVCFVTGTVHVTDERQRPSVVAVGSDLQEPKSTIPFLVTTKSIEWENEPDPQQQKGGIATHIKLLQIHKSSSRVWLWLFFLADSMQKIPITTEWLSIPSADSQFFEHFMTPDPGIRIPIFQIGLFRCTPSYFHF